MQLWVYLCRRILSTTSQDHGAEMYLERGEEREVKDEAGQAGGNTRIQTAYVSCAHRRGYVLAESPVPLMQCGAPALGIGVGPRVTTESV